MRVHSFRAVALTALLLQACLGPATSDRPGYSPNIISTHALIPAIENDKRLSQQIDTNDGIDGSLVSLRGAYSGGHPVSYWDFGTASTSSFPPLWLFRGADANKQPVDFGHPNLIDSVPGDPGYSSVRALYLVFVTGAYKGQQIVSAQALEDAIELGLVKKPMATGKLANCPVTLATTQLDMGSNREPRDPDVLYYRGKTVSYFALDAMDLGVADFQLDKSGKLVAPNAYLPRRQNETRALDETLWHADLDDNGDTTDTNVIFQVAADDAKYNSLWRQINVTVPSDYAFGTSQAESDLFERGATGIRAIDGAVVDYQDTGTLLNRPIFVGMP
jgi:hypothetical protein